MEYFYIAVNLVISLSVPILFLCFVFWLIFRRKNIENTSTLPISEADKSTSEKLIRSGIVFYVVCLFAEWFPVGLGILYIHGVGKLLLITLPLSQIVAIGILVNQKSLSSVKKFFVFLPFLVAAAFVIWLKLELN